MNKIDHLLVILSEECSEITKEVSKALRFGLDDKEPGQDLTNREKIQQEYTDLMGVIALLVNEGVITNSLDVEGMNNKIQKIKRFMEYSEKSGRLIKEEKTK